MSELLTVKEAAERMRLGMRTVEKAIATGELPSLKIGRRRLVTQDGIDQFLRLAARRGRVA
jgi:excisionase family DNA binding protein